MGDYETMPENLAARLEALEAWVVRHDGGFGPEPVPVPETPVPAPPRKAAKR